MDTYYNAEEVQLRGSTMFCRSTPYIWGKYEYPGCFATAVFASDEGVQQQSHSWYGGVT